MTAIPPRQEAALRDVHALFGRAPVLIGGAALGVHMNMSWRTTKDLDLVIAVEHETAIDELAARSGWRRTPGVGHRWAHGEHTLVDIIPVTPAAMRMGWLRWSPSDAVINLAGLELAGVHAVEIQLSDGTALRVAPIPVLALLKMASFLDRPHDRQRDLADIGWMLQTYVDDFDDRRFDTRLGEIGVEYDEGAAFLIGEELDRLATPKYASLIGRFVSAVEGPWLDAFATQGPPVWDRQSSAAARQLRAFRLGFKEGLP